MITKQSLKDPFKLVKEIFTPLGSLIPEKLKAEKRTALYGFICGGFQKTIELAFFGQVINYTFTTRKQKIPYNWTVSNVYKTFPKNFNSLIPYYTATRSMQAGFPQIKNRCWTIRTLTPIVVLPYEHAFSFVMNKINPSIPRPICSVYHNIVPFTCMEWMNQASSDIIKPKLISAFNTVLPKGWSQLLSCGLSNSMCYFLNHPLHIVNVYMKQHPRSNVIQSIKEIYQMKGLKGFYTDVLHRCIRAAHSSIVTSLAGVAFDTLFLKKKEDDKKSLEKKWFRLQCFC